MPSTRSLPDVHDVLAAMFALLRAAADYADDAGVALRVGPVLTADAFYQPDPTLVPRATDWLGAGPVASAV